MFLQRICVAVIFALASLRAEDSLPDLPDPNGRAGMMAAVVLGEDGHDAILAAGGANFPNRPPWDGGAKVFHRDIFLLQRQAGRNWTWRKVGDLPEPVAYAAFCASIDRRCLLVAGGANSDRHLDAVWRIHSDGSCERFAPKLPEPRAYAGFASLEGELILLGGSNAPDAAPALETAASISLAHPEDGWRVSNRSVDHARILPLMGAFGRSVIWGGGCGLVAVGSKPLRTYRKDFHLGGEWLGGLKNWDLETQLAAAAGPGVRTSTGLLFVGGDTGTHSGKPLESHSGQSRDILHIDLKTKKMTVLGQWPTPLATAPLLRLEDDLVTISGETKPGLRTPACSRWRIPRSYR